ncbi:unnamed protein product [Scytosiphon promiscuus]
MCGGLLAYGWGRLVARDMHDQALAEIAAARLQQQEEQGQERWRAGSLGSTGLAAAAAATAALSEDWDEEEGGIPSAAASGAAAAASAAAMAGRGSVFNGSSRGGLKIAEVPSPSSGWSLREDEDEDENREGGQGGKDAGGAEEDNDGGGKGLPRKVSLPRANSHLQHGFGGSGGGAEDRSGALLLDVDVDDHDDDDDDDDGDDDFGGTGTADNEFSGLTTSSSSVTQRPRARSSTGVNRARRGGESLSSGLEGAAGSGTGGDRSGRSGGSVSGGSGVASSSARRLGRLCALIRSLRRVAVRRGLLDWRQLGMGTAGFAAGLTCFAVQGSSATAGWYHLWHGAWHVLAMSSAVPILRARRWGPVESDPDADGGLWGCGGGGGSSGSGSIREGDEQPQQQQQQIPPRSARGVGLMARLASFRAGLGGRVETRGSSYEMVPRD